MNLPVAATQRAAPLVDIIDLKWLLASEGVHVHVERLLGDPAYAEAVLAPAEASPRQAVRDAARRVRQGLAARTAGT